MRTGFGLNQPARRLLLEWLALTLCLVLIAIAATLHAIRPAQHWSSLHRVDALVHDSLGSLTSIAASPALVLVEIDDASLARFGRWPWRRAIHATMIDKLVAAGARTIALDVMFVEEHADDPILARSLQAARDAGTRVLLVISRSGGINDSGMVDALYPVPELGLLAELGHAHFRIDGDGVVRGQHLNEAGFPSLALALVPEGRRAQLQPIARDAWPATSGSAGQGTRDRAAAQASWQMRDFVWLSALNTTLQRRSYADLLTAPADSLDLRDRIVLIGATAIGIGDQYANSLLPTGATAAGVELHAAAYSAIVQRKLVLPMSAATATSVTAGAVLLVMGALYRLRPRSGLLLVLAALIATLALCAGIRLAGFWWPPSATLLMIAIAYPLWSWRRLEVATAGLVRQAKTLALEPALATRAQRARRRPGDPVARSVQRLQMAASDSIAWRRLVETTLRKLPHPAALTDQDGVIVLCNDAFSRAFVTVEGEVPAPGAALGAWLKRSCGLDIDAISDSTHEASDDRGRDWLIENARVERDIDERWQLLQFVDLSPIRAAQREREQTLRFLSHDLRNPLVSILTILGQRNRDEAAPPAWIAQVEQLAQRSLELAEGFVQLARAEVQSISPEPLDLAQLLIEASDLCYAQARRRDIRLVHLQAGSAGDAGGADGASGAGDDEATALVMGDAQLLRRALMNLLDNAIKFSPPGTSVLLAIERSGEGWCASVSDEGPGLDEHSLEHLFEPFWRSGSQQFSSGAGLGLSFVRVVAQRHDGQVRALRRQAGGARFELLLPAA